MLRKVFPHIEEAPALCSGSSAESPPPQLNPEGLPYGKNQRRVSTGWDGCCFLLLCSTPLLLFAGNIWNSGGFQDCDAGRRETEMG